MSLVTHASGCDAIPCILARPRRTLRISARTSKGELVTWPMCSVPSGFFMKTSLRNASVVSHCLPSARRLTTHFRFHKVGTKASDVRTVPQMRATHLQYRSCWLTRESPRPRLVRSVARLRSITVRISIETRSLGARTLASSEMKSLKSSAGYLIGSVVKSRYAWYRSISFHITSKT